MTKEQILLEALKKIAGMYDPYSEPMDELMSNIATEAIAAHEQGGDKPKATGKELELEMQRDYPLIPMSEITEEARLLAVAWVEGYERQGMDIPGKQKLASDIMNYARRNSSQ